MVIGISAAIVAFAIVVIFFGPSKWSKAKEESSDKPIICACRAKDRVGVVLRSDYDAAWQLHMQSFSTGKVSHDPRKTKPRGTVAVRHTFVFTTTSPEYKRLREICVVESAIFEVPYWPPGTEDEEFQRAHDYFFHREP